MLSLLRQWTETNTHWSSPNQTQCVGSPSDEARFTLLCVVIPFWRRPPENEGLVGQFLTLSLTFVYGLEETEYKKISLQTLKNVT